MIRDYFKIFFESSGDSVMLIKKDDFTIIDFNLSAMNLYGISVENSKNIIGKSYSFFKSSEFNFLKNTAKDSIYLEIEKTGKWSTVLSIKNNQNKLLTVETKISFLKHNEIDYLLVVTEKLFNQDIKNSKELIEHESIQVEIVNKANLLLEKEILKHKKTQEEYVKSQEFINSMINSSIDMIIASDVNSNITHISPSASYLFGYSEDEFKKLKIEDLYKDKQTFKVVNEQINETGFFIGEITNKNKKGKLFNSYLSASPIKNKQNKVIGLMGVSRDVEEIKKIEKEIIESERRYRELFENLTDAILIIDAKNNIIDINNAGKKLFEIKDKKAININSFITENYKNIVREKYKELQEKGIIKNVELEIITKKGNKKVIEVSSNAFYEKQKFKGSRNIFRDITKKKQRDLLLQEQSSKIDSVFKNSSNVSIWTLDTNFKLTSVNKEFIRVFKEKLNIEVEIGVDFFDLIKNNVKERLKKTMKLLYNKAQKGISQKVESSLYDNKGNQILFETFLSPIKIEGNKKFELACLAVDLTDKKEIEQELRNSLKEKEILLKEVHHRVKNNLQVISSILNLQSSYIKDESTLNILRESQNRIKSMSFIHEILYRSDNFSEINFSSYITSLSKNLVQSYILENNNISLELELEKIKLNLDQAIPCGLIINELVSNSIKYAFPNKTKGKIKIELTEKNRIIFLKVEDNGIGLPKNLDIEKTDTLGLQLVYMLVNQLEGEIKAINKTGTKYLINFTKQN